MATRFNAGPDRNGLLFSELHLQAGLGTWVHGTVKHVYKRRGRQAQKYKILYDGDNTQSVSEGSHVMALEQDDDEDASEDNEGPSDAETEEEDQTSRGNSTDPVTSIDNTHTDSENEDGDAPLGGEPGSVAMGATVECGGLDWKRVESMGVDVREERGEFDLQFKDYNTHDGTTECDIFNELFPVDREWVLEVVRGRATEANDKYRNNWHEEHIDGFLICVFGATQFKPGTDLWSTTRKGMMPPPGFERHLSKDRFDRVLRYLVRGPVGTEEELTDDAWAEVRPWSEGYNKKRKDKLIAGSKVTPDEDMFTWTGKKGVGGMPHVSFISRKPRSLGCELKSVCDAGTGIKLFIEIQEGKVKDARKEFRRMYPAATACTLRLLKGAGVCEKDLDEADRTQRHCVIDSWFANMTTVKAVRKEMGVHVSPL